MNKLEQTIAKYGYKASDFSECQLETIQGALDNNLDVSTIVNPKVDELVMNVVVYETVAKPGQISMLPYLYSGVKFSQLKYIRQAVENNDTKKLKQYFELFKRDDFSDKRKYALSILITRGINHNDLLDSKLDDDKLDKSVRSRLPALYGNAFTL